jgi:hypothetical protein
VSEAGPFNSATSALTIQPRSPVVGDEVGMETLWLSLQRRPWQSLAVLAASKGVATLEAANSLARMGWWFTGQPTCVFDMRDLSLRLLEDQIRSMGAQLQGGERAFVALRSLTENPTAGPIAMAADAVVLCVELAKTDIKGAQKAIASIGRDKFIGTILVSSAGVPITPPADGHDGTK